MLRFMSPSLEQFEFVVARDRDAAATIRGFVLQVGRTIEAWLDLPDGDRLEIERGEDLDWIVNGGPDPHQLLEQIKARKRPLTLQSQEARQALAHHFEHRRANPTLRLRFRFTTTATLGRERRSPFQAPDSGISVWEGIRLGVVTSPRDEQLLDDLRSLVQRSSQPQHLPPALWMDFKAFVVSASSDDWRGFVTSLEWSTGAAHLESRRSNIIGRLQSEFGATTAPEAELHFQTLFAFVFDHLCLTPRAPLTRALLLQTLRQIPGGEHARRISELAGLYAIVDRRVGVLEREVQTVAAVVSQTQSAIQRLTAQSGIMARVDLQAVEATTSAAPSASHRTRWPPVR